MSSSRRYGNPSWDSNHRGPTRSNYNNRDDNPRNSSNHYDRSPPPSRRYTPPHDRRQTPPRMKPDRGGYSESRDWDDRNDRDNYLREQDRYPRGRSPHHPGYRGGYRDRDREGYRSPKYDDDDNRSRSRSPQRRSRSPYYGGPPSKEVMLDGLPPELAEEDIIKELKRYHDIDKLDDVRIIRDRQTKSSRGFGFLRFPTIQKSKAFLEQNYPTLYLYGNHDSADGNEKAAKIRIAFSRERDDRRGAEKHEGDWVCKICTIINFQGRKACFKCQTPLSEMIAFNNTAQAKQPEFLNSGDSDASDGPPSQFLLIRGLEPTVTEELLAKGAVKLCKPSGPGSQSNISQPKKGNTKVASTTGDVSLGAKEGSLRRVLLIRDRRTNESWRYGFAEFSSADEAQAALLRYNSFEKFTISSKPVVASYIHAGVFAPLFQFNEGYETYSFCPLGNDSLRLQYWDENAYVSELTVSTGEEDAINNADDIQVKTSVDGGATAAEKEGLIATGEEAEAKTRKRKAENKDSSKPKKAAPAHLQFWSNRHAELHGVPVKKKAETGHENEDEAQKTKTGPILETQKTVKQSFSDPNKKCCYLCARQFKTDAEVKKHEDASQLHRDNLDNEDLKAKAIAKMTKAGLPIHPIDDDTPEYRDRARERRAAFGGSKKISLPLKKPPPSTTTIPVPNAKDNNDSPPPTQSKGATLLGKMGWTSGEGLGAQGKGMTAPIATDLYVAGVGLGAQGGKVGDAVEEAERNTKGGYGDFLERTRDKAKERFDKMG